MPQWIIFSNFPVTFHFIYLLTMKSSLVVTFMTTSTYFTHFETALFLLNLLLFAFEWTCAILPSKHTNDSKEYHYLFPRLCNFLLLI